MAGLGFRASAPHARTRPWAASSRLVLFVPILTNLVLPPSSLLTIDFDSDVDKQSLRVQVHGQRPV